MKKDRVLYLDFRTRDIRHNSRDLSKVDFTGQVHRKRVSHSAADLPTDTAWTEQGGVGDADTLRCHDFCKCGILFTPRPTLQT